jgi:predicted AAA+ superfamily ATPase
MLLASDAVPAISLLVLRWRKLGPRPRIVDGLLDKLLCSFPAISLVGPRAAGKTITAVRRGGAVLRLGRSSTVS